MKGVRGQDEQGRWLAAPANTAEAALREALDKAVAREADEVALRRVWARVADLPEQTPAVMAADAVLDAAGADDVLDAAVSRRTRWPWLVAASLAGATAALALMLVQTRSQVQGQARGDGHADGSAKISATATLGGSEDSTTTGRGSSVVVPATVRTGAGETLHLTLRGGTDVVVLSESVLVLDDNDSPSVAAGEVQFHVPRQTPGHNFAVAVRDYRVVVVGTRFSVRADRERTAVAVSEGVVEIWTDQRIARVTAGESWSASVETVDTVGSGVKAAGGPAAEAAVPAAAAARIANDSGAASRARAVKGARLSRGGSAKAPRAVLALAAPSGAADVTQSPAFGSVTGPTVAAATPAPSGSNVGAGAPVVETAAPSPAAPAVAPTPIEAPLAMQARAARAAGDSRRALGLYRTLAQRGGAAGENAEYEMGRLLRDSLHQPREALAVWREYRTAHPRGLLRVEADISVIETLVSLGDRSNALAEATEFMRRYPESERRTEIARLTGDLLRERGDCGAAIGAYDTALSGRVRRGMADGVTFHRAVCLQRQDRAAGTAALRAYLQSFPSGLFRGDAQKLLATSGQSAATAPTP